MSFKVMNSDEKQQLGHLHLLSQIRIWSFFFLILFHFELSGFLPLLSKFTFSHFCMRCYQPLSFLRTIKAKKQPLSWKLTLVSRTTLLMSLQRLLREKSGAWVCNLFLWLRRAIGELMLSYGFRIYLAESVLYNTLQVYYGKWEVMVAVEEEGSWVTTAIHYDMRTWACYPPHRARPLPGPSWHTAEHSWTDDRITSSEKSLEEVPGGNTTQRTWQNWVKPSPSFSHTRGVAPVSFSLSQRVPLHLPTASRAACCFLPFSSLQEMSPISHINPCHFWWSPRQEEHDYAAFVEFSV